MYECWHLDLSRMWSRRLGLEGIVASGNGVWDRRRMSEWLESVRSQPDHDAAGLDAIQD